MNHLAHRAEFEQILNNYQFSSQAIELLKTMKLALLCGPSAAGRNTIIDKLVAKGGYRYIVSDTTREPRVNNGVLEQSGVNYWFRTEEEFLADLKEGKFLEAEIIHGQQVSGISIRELKNAHDSGLIAIDEVELGGIKNILSLKPDTIGIFILPPSFEVWLERLFNRGSMPKSELIRRIHTAVGVFAEAAENPLTHIVVNEDIDRATTEVDKIVRSESTPVKAEGKRLAEELLHAAADYLAKADKHFGTLDYRVLEG